MRRETSLGARQRRGLRLAVVGLGLLATHCGGAAPRPNVVLITLDTTRADHLGLYGYARPTSPHLDALALRSTVYERAYSTSSWTLPAHASLFTGKYPASHGVRHDPAGELDFQEEVPGFQQELRARALDPDEETLARRLARAGYATGAVVGGPWMLSPFGLGSGFEHYDDEGAASASGRAGTSVTDGALSWLDERAEGDDRPLFLFLNYFDAHAPYEPPAAWAKAFQSRGRKGEPSRRRREIDLYDAEIRYMDHEIGRLFEGLAARGVGDDTWIIVTGDHGELFGEHGWWRHERFLWEPLVRVPLIVMRPGGAPTRIDEPVSLVDVFHWILEAAGQPAPRETPSGSLLAEVHPPSPDAKSGTWRALWRGSTKTLWSSRGELLQFDVVRDPGEQQDLLDGDGVGSEAARRALGEAFDALPPPTARREVPVDDETRRALEALGYLE